MAKLRFGGHAINRFGLERFVGGAELLRSFGDCLLQRQRALGFALGGAARGSVLPQRHDRDRALDGERHAYDVALLTHTLDATISRS
ncbi:MAG: hypothetical protein ABIR51_01635, partial [Sphingomicrobium sp.]